MKWMFPNFDIDLQEYNTSFSMFDGETPKLSTESTDMRLINGGTCLLDVNYRLHKTNHVIRHGIYPVNKRMSGEELLRMGFRVGSTMEMHVPSWTEDNREQLKRRHGTLTFDPSTQTVLDFCGEVAKLAGIKPVDIMSIGFWVCPEHPIIFSHEELERERKIYQARGFSEEKLKKAPLHKQAVHESTRLKHQSEAERRREMSKERLKYEELATEKVILERKWADCLLTYPDIANGRTDFEQFLARVKDNAKSCTHLSNHIQATIHQELAIEKEFHSNFEDFFRLYDFVVRPRSPPYELFTQEVTAPQVKKTRKTKKAKKVKTT